MSTEVEENVPSFDFGKKKKKKKVVAKKDEEEEIEEKEEPVKAEVVEKKPVDDDDEDESEAFTPKEVKDDDTAFVDDDKADDATPSSEERKEFVLDVGNSDRDYTYKELAGRIFSLIARPEERTVYKMKPPVVYREGTKKTVWVNFPEICKIMNRQPEHVMSYVLAEVGSTGSIDGSGRLVLRGRFQPKHIENLLRSYIGEYVKCHTCKGPETVLKKENRLLFVACEKCGSTRSVAAIKTGFQAASRAGRRAARAGAT
eukprot:TRINITY_DN14396_c0_g1_i1.p2 TRINITY_DN14396_c0_g1~~TRINITY_DN14396_c0_g1_i1.p2  ORF type:complete len:258 (+),score=110.89 TRINITY_DN14396_c0_g1_i1:122-895(+)